MKIIKLGMRLWITLASLMSFLAGWIFFAHSNKPAPLQTSQPAQPSVSLVQPAQPFVQNEQPQFRPFTFQNQSPVFQPRLRTGGS